MSATLLVPSVPRGRDRRGFTLIEVVISLTMLTGAVLALAISTTSFRKSVGDSNVRSRALARADLQVTMARTWPTWNTLENLAGGSYNGTADGLTTTTTVVADTTNGKAIKRVTVTITASPTSLMPLPVTRYMSVAVP